MTDKTIDTNSDLKQFVDLKRGDQDELERVPFAIVGRAWAEKLFRERLFSDDVDTVYEAYKEMGEELSWTDETHGALKAYGLPAAEAALAELGHDPTMIGPF